MVFHEILRQQYKKAQTRHACKIEILVRKRRLRLPQKSKVEDSKT